MRRIVEPYTTPVFDNQSTVEAASEIIDLGTAKVRLSVNTIANNGAAEDEFIDGVLADGEITIVDYQELAGVTVTVAGHDLVEGEDWDAETDEATTAANLAAAIDALDEVVASSAMAVITIEAAEVGADGNEITLATDAEPEGLTLSGETLEGGIDSDIDAALFTIRLANHAFKAGMNVTFDVDAGDAPTNLTDTNTYYVINVDENHIALAETLEDAEEDVRIEIADADDAVGGGAFTLTPETPDLDYVIAGSNDGVNFVSLASGTISSSAPVLSSFPEPCFRFLKVSLDPNATEPIVSVILHTKI